MERAVEGGASQQGAGRQRTAPGTGGQAPGEVGSGAKRYVNKGMNFAEGEAALRPPEADAGVADANVKAAISASSQQTSAQVMPEPIDVNDAYAKVVATTNAQRLSRTSKRAKATAKELFAKWLETHPGASDQDAAYKAYESGAWFKQFWMERCNEFAMAVIKAGGDNSTRDTIMKVSDKDYVRPEEGEPGESTLYRGMSLAAVGEAEKSHQNLMVGTAIHIKMHWDIDAPYLPKQDFHHWVVYAGNGLFSDSLTGKNQTGAKMDGVHKVWFAGKYALPQYKFDKKDPELFREVRPGRWVPRDDAMPRVTATYGPTAKPNVSSDS